MSKKDQHVVPDNGGWAAKGIGNGKSTKIVAMPADTIKTARVIAINQKPEIVIHRPNGRVRDKESYENDPRNKEG